MPFDPVCGMEVDEACKLKYEYDKKSYRFCNKKCLEKFKKNAKKYLEQKPAIQLEDVHKEYDLGEVKVKVLHGLSLRINEGELVAIVGKSGSGKSTALNMIGTLDTPTSGKVFIAGREASTMTENELAALRADKIGFIFQQFNLIPSLNALENVMLPNILQGTADNKQKKRAESLLNEVGLKGRTDHKPSELSGGEQQRVAVARAFMNDPDIILADEPTGNLDSTTSTKIVDLLLELWKEKKKTVVIITHDPQVAEKAERILNIKDGKLVKNGDVTEQSVWS